MEVLKSVINIIFVLIINLFTKSKASFDSKVSPEVFFKLISNPRWKVNIRDTIFGRGVAISEGNNFFNKPEIFGNVHIGRYTSVSGPSTRICAYVNSVQIGAFCSIASSVVIQEYNHYLNRATTFNIFTNIFQDKRNSTQFMSKGDIIIEDDVWIGSNSIILSGVKIGRGSIIGAGSVVTKDVDRYNIVGGNPAKTLRKRFSEREIENLEESKWWTWSKEKILNEHEFFCKERV